MGRFADATRSGFGLPINHSPHLAICDFYLATCYHMLAETRTVMTSAQPLFVVCSISTGISIVLFTNKLDRLTTSVKREINPKRAEGRKVLKSAGTIKTLFYLSHRDLGC